MVEVVEVVGLAVAVVITMVEVVVVLLIQVFQILHYHNLVFLEIPIHTMFRALEQQGQVME